MRLEFQCFRLFWIWPLLLLGCAASPRPTSEVSALAPAPKPALLPKEAHLADLRQLTFGGENAEAYWSFDGKELSFQARRGGEDCDRIRRITLDPLDELPVSSGKGATTCAHFLPGNQELIYASTHLGGEGCPPKPDRSMGYVWPLYDTYDIFKVKLDGSGLTPLTREKGYDAEDTVCGKDGSIVFTSTREGDLELYRMDANGQNVKRLTNAPGYDGGAFFNAECTKIVWRASRPRPGHELKDYRALLARGLVRPSKLELYVANADGSEAAQITWLGAASFAPFFHPSGKRIIFSSNHGDPKGREFDLFAVNVDGTGLERVTYAPGFDGFPMFSPDGRWLAFSSNRSTAEGQADTNVFVARWVEPPLPRGDRAADRVAQDVAWLASKERDGRGIGTEGLEEAGAHIEKRFAALGLKPLGDGGGYRQRFPVTTAVATSAATAVKLDGVELPKDAYAVLGFSAQGEVSGPMVLAGYGITDPNLGVDHYARIDAKGKVVVVRRFVPQTPAFAPTDRQRRFGDIRYKAWIAREREAKALIVVDWPEPPSPPEKGFEPPPEARLPSGSPEGPGDAGIPVLVVKRSALTPLIPKLTAGTRIESELTIGLTKKNADAFNVVGLLEGASAFPTAIVIGAHYDHLGLGGRHSLAPDKTEPHLGADDNASGVAALLEIARELSARRGEVKRDVLFVAFSAEESGVLGSTHFTRERGEAGMKGIAAMINLDMVGRLRGNRLTVLGSDSAEEWGSLIKPACEKARVECVTFGDGYGPSDQTPFYAAGVPVLHFFTGAHSDYHKPSDAPEGVNAAGVAQVASIVASVALSLGERGALSYRKVPSPAPRGDLRSFNASLGTVPDYAGPANGQKGVLLSAVRPGGGADQAGMRRGDILIRLGKHEIGSVEDFMYVLNSSKPGETVTAVILRDGQEVHLETTFQETKRR